MNKLSVWTYPYTKKHYLTHPWKWWKDTYWNFRNWWHRGKYGYAYVDVWNWAEWWPKVGAAALKYLKEHGSGYPGVEPWETPEKWANYLDKLSDLLEWCADSQEIEYSENEYEKEFHEMCNQNRIKTGNGWSYEDLSVKDKIIKNKYLEREEELQKEYNDRRANILAEIGHNLPRFWD